MTFDEMGGVTILRTISKIFYDKVYKDPWIGLYFKGISQEVIEAQQVDFMSEALGGPKNYQGKFPIPAHKHMLISEELFDLRQVLLKEAFNEANACVELQEKWLKIDQAFRPGLVKKSLDACEKRYETDTILDFPNPNKRAA